MRIIIYYILWGEKVSISEKTKRCIKKPGILSGLVGYCKKYESVPNGDISSGLWDRRSYVLRNAHAALLRIRSNPPWR